MLQIARRARWRERPAFRASRWRHRSHRAPPVAPSSPAAEGPRVRIPVDELMTMQGVYRKWVGTLPPSLEASATVDALRAICELDLSKLDSVEPPRGFGRD